MSMTISDYFDDPERAIDEASVNATTSWEMDFMTDMEERFDEYGDDMYLSERQHEVLERLIGT